MDENPLPPTLLAVWQLGSSTCAPYPLNPALAAIPEQGAAAQCSPSERCPSWYPHSRRFLGPSLVHRESITVPTAHRQCQYDPTSPEVEGLYPCWICPPAPWDTDGGTDLSLGISKQDQLLADEGRTTSQVWSPPGLRRPHPLSPRCIFISSSTIGPPPLGPW